MPFPLLLIFFLFLPLFLSSTHVPHFFFSLFFLLHTHTLTLFFFLLLSSFVTYHFLQTPELALLLPLPFFFFLIPFFLSPFSLSTYFLPLLKIYPYSFSFFPSFLFFSFTLFCSLFLPERSIDSQSSPSSSLFFSPFLLAHCL